MSHRHAKTKRVRKREDQDRWAKRRQARHAKKLKDHQRGRKKPAA